MRFLGYQIGLRTTARVLLCTCAMLWATPAAGAVKMTATGIALDAPWKVTIYNLARTKFKHPAWGWQHCERNYQIALQLARGDRLIVDKDVLFAAAFLHDMAAFPPYEMKGVEHGLRAAYTSVAVLRNAAFPWQSWRGSKRRSAGTCTTATPATRPRRSSCTTRTRSIS